MRPTALLAIILATATLAAAAPAADQGGADAGPRVLLLHDGAAAPGATAVGAVNTFTWLLLDGEERPDFHNNAVFEVTLNNATLLRTTAASGHDYDGVDAYRVVFPEPGRFTARVTIGDDGPTATVEGRVLPATPVEAAVDADVPAEVAAGAPVDLTYALTTGDGAAAADSRFTVSVRRVDDGFEAFRVDTRAADGAHAIRYAFPEPGAYEVRLTGHRPAADGRAPVAAATATHAVAVGQGAALPAGAPTEEPLTNAVTTGTAADGYAIHGTYDPYTSVGPHGRMRLGVVVLDQGTGAPAANVSFTATLAGPGGETLFEAADLREADGILEVITAQPRVGDYTLRVAAARGGAPVGEVAHTFSVLPPAVALGSGPQFTTLEGADGLKAGEARDVVAFVGDAAGAPLMHSEVDFQLLGPGGAPLLGGKLHTHSDGRFPLTLTAPAAGAHALEVLPANLHPAPTPRYYGPEAGQAPVFALDVAEGPGLPAVADEPLGDAAADDVTSAVPGAGALAALAAVALAAVAARRR